MWSSASPSCLSKILMFSDSYVYTQIVYNTVIDCSSLNDPDNGRVDTSNGTTFGSTATYTCDTGYALSGSQSRSCGADGNWTPIVPQCRPWGKSFTTYMTL